MKPPAKKAPKKTATPAPAPEPANIRVRTIGNRVLIGRAICSGNVPFGVTKSQADALVAAGLATITGVF